MRLVISKSIPVQYHEDIKAAVAQGFHGVASAGVEVHVKAKGRPNEAVLRRWRKAGRPADERLQTMMWAQDDRHQRSFTGRCYAGVPSIARVAATTRQLVTLAIPPGPDGITYPRSWSYPNLSTAPVVTFASWREELLHLAAHEASHVRQRRVRGGRQSEILAERWALRTLDYWRGAT